MKGISAVIATILMLMITIALAGTAYLFISGVFTSRTSVVLSVDGTASLCNPSSLTGANGTIILVVKNDGTGVATAITSSITNPSGGVITTNCSMGTMNFTNGGNSIPAGQSAFAVCNRTSGNGLFGVNLVGGGSTSRGSVYCSS